MGHNVFFMEQPLRLAWSNGDLVCASIVDYYSERRSAENETVGPAEARLIFELCAGIGLGTDSDPQSLGLAVGPPLRLSKAAFRLIHERLQRDEMLWAKSVWICWALRNTSVLNLKHLVPADLQRYWPPAALQPAPQAKVAGLAQGT